MLFEIISVIDRKDMQMITIANIFLLNLNCFILALILIQLIDYLWVC